MINNFLFLIYWIYYRRKNKYGWSEWEFSKIIKNKNFNEIEWVYKLKKHFRRLGIFNFLYSFSLISIIGFFLSFQSIVNSLSIEYDNSYIYLDLTGIWQITGFSIDGSRTYLELNNIWYLNIGIILSILINLLSSYFYIKHSHFNKFEKYSLNNECYNGTKIFGINIKNNSYIWKIFALISFVIVASYFLIIIFDTEKPNIDGYISYNEKLYRFLNYKIVNIYNSYWKIETYYKWYSKMLIIIFFVTFIISIIFLSSIYKKIILVAKNQIVIEYRKWANIN